MTFIAPFQLVPMGVIRDIDIYWIDPVTGEHYWYNVFDYHWAIIGNWLYYNGNTWFMHIANIMGTQ